MHLGWTLLVSTWLLFAASTAEVPIRLLLNPQSDLPKLPLYPFLHLQLRGGSSGEDKPLTIFAVIPGSNGTSKESLILEDSNTAARNVQILEATEDRTETWNTPVPGSADGGAAEHGKEGIHNELRDMQLALDTKLIYLASQCYPTCHKRLRHSLLRHCVASPRGSWRRRGTVDALVDLVDRGANVNRLIVTRDEERGVEDWGLTALHAAAMAGQVTACPRLISGRHESEQPRCIEVFYEHRWRLRKNSFPLART
jgi:hypothetical protein